MAVAMAVAEATHHSSRGQRPATAIREETNNAPWRQKAAPPGMWPASLAEPQGTQVLVRHVAEQVLDAPVVPILAAVDQFWEILRLLDSPMAAAYCGAER